MFTWVVILRCHLVCGGGRQCHHASLTQAKRDLKTEKIRSPNDAWKGYLKTWDCWNSQSFQGLFPWTPQGGLIAPPWTPSCKGQHTDAHWVTRLILTSFCMQYLCTGPFFRNKIPFSPLKTPKTHAVWGV